MILSLQATAVDAQSCAAELHQAFAKSNYQQASNLIRLAPHSGVFEMVNKQQQNALHLAGENALHSFIPNTCRKAQQAQQAQLMLCTVAINCLQPVWSCAILDHF